jgi:hypothetical protein
MLSLLLLAATASLLLAAGPGRRRALRFYVSPDGDDRWSGRLPQPNSTRTDGPFATLTRARDAIRALKRAAGGLPAPVRVLLRDGTYFLPAPLVFGPEDSGTCECPITYAAFPGEQPVISGGQPLGGWELRRVNRRRAWVVELPEVAAGRWYFRQLWVNGQRRYRPRLPAKKWYYFADLLDITADTPWSQGQRRARFARGHIRHWRNLTDVEVVTLQLWRESRLPIADVDEKQGIVSFAKQSVTRLTEDFALRPGRYYVENVFEALTRPGQWYLDRSCGVLYYLPLPGEEPTEAEVIAPRLAQLVRVQGSAEAGQRVEHLHLRGLTFSHSDWYLPADQAGAAQAAVNVPGALYYEHAAHCSLVDCTISHVSNYAVEFGPGCADNLISRCELWDLGAGGVKVGHGSARTTISDNEIHHGGLIFHSAVAVWVGNSGHNRIVHNHLHHFFYTGISLGWTWGYGPSDATHNLVEYNHIHDIGQGLLSDMGGIYTLGISPGTRLRYNLIHDVESYSYGGWGIYPDEGSSYLRIENNLVYRTKSGGFHQHYGRENLVRNNIFAFAREGQIQRSRVEDHQSFIFHHNIVLWERGPLLHGNWQQVQASFDYNLYWRLGGKPFDFAGRTLKQWQALGQDLHSLVADPHFANPRAGDFSLQPGSPALSIGFKPFDLSRVGPRKGRRAGPRR